MSHGVAMEKLAALPAFRTDPLFSDAERAALACAEAGTATPSAVTDEVFAEVTRHFTEAQIVELAFTIATENFRARFNTTLGVEAQGLCVLPPR